ncbi:hypothetical protein RvVAT039_pl03240 (plasmid) [Agrobacterium vitis]|nr:hypothetical protein RvVAT039_pl03240 [Agrobacterium vitis]
MDVLICIASLAFLIFMAYRGFSVILFAPIAALLAVLVTQPSLVPVTYSGVFLNAMANFLKAYFPIFLLGAVFGVRARTAQNHTLAVNKQRTSGCPRYSG